jgi:hypothetical protein
LEHGARNARLGAIAVLSRGANPKAGHVGFWLGETEAEPVPLAGNQSDEVIVAAFTRSQVLGYRWPTVIAPASNQVVSSLALSFDEALAHVL